MVFWGRTVVKKTQKKKKKSRARRSPKSQSAQNDAKPKRDEEYFIAHVYQKSNRSRFTQDSPILADVFVHYGLLRDKSQGLDLLLTPDWSKTPAEVSRELGVWLGEGDDDARFQIAYNQSVVAVRLTFEELLTHVLPMSWWWQNCMMANKSMNLISAYNDEYMHRIVRDELIELLHSDIARHREDHGSGNANASNGAHLKPQERPPAFSAKHKMILGDLAWAARLFWLVQHSNRHDEPDAPDDQAELIADYFFTEILEKMSTHQRDCHTKSGKTPPEDPWVFSVNRNRPLYSTVFDSIKTTKVDAATQTFGVKGRGIRWAIIDTGIDARHPAFRRSDDDGQRYEKPFDGSGRTRIKATYDFSNIRTKLSRQQRRSLTSGRLLDWEAMEEDPDVQLRIHHTEDDYKTPTNAHGTHVAGIMAADWEIESADPLGPPSTREARQEPLKGLCPEVTLYDLRVFKDDGTGDEFAVMSALQFVRSLNQRHDTLEIHGVNLSLAMQHEVSNYACGRTPVCDECTKLVGNGVVVVAAAGNDGRSVYLTPQRAEQEGYRAISITDPGNADPVITVGSTHRRDAHTYGVSYFSSRGPTGDGRLKPDLVAPGEKILSTIPDEQTSREDGTSQATPHVSGAAALLMNRHWELVGQPDLVKKILMDTATDLGRERHFQGAGLVDVLRAIQSV